jgi:hypothetical protein
MVITKGKVARERFNDASIAASDMMRECSANDYKAMMNATGLNDSIVTILDLTMDYLTLYMIAPNAKFTFHDGYHLDANINGHVISCSYGCFSHRTSSGVVIIEPCNLASYIATL